MLNVKLLFLD